jgi:hypothetical protein
MMRKRIIVGLAAFLIVIQFIRPARNSSEQPTPNEIANHYPVPDEVHAILKHSCYDCHSNHTLYPWYANVQPVGWWLQWHIHDAQDELNFSEFGTYSEKRAKHKFEEIGEVLTDGSMPLYSYTLLHRDTKLTAEQSKVVIDWAKGLK